MAPPRPPLPPSSRVDRAGGVVRRGTERRVWSAPLRGCSVTKPAEPSIRPSGVSCTLVRAAGRVSRAVAEGATVCVLRCGTGMLDPWLRPPDLGAGKEGGAT